MSSRTSSEPQESDGSDAQARGNFSLRASPSRPRRKQHRRNPSVSRTTMPLRGEDENNGSESDTKTAKIEPSATLSKQAHSRSPPIYTIRPMAFSDIRTVYKLGLTIFTSKEFPNMYRTWDDFGVVENFGSSREFCFVAESNKEIVGFLLGETLTKYNVGTRGYIQWVGVLPAYRRFHIASSLLQSFTRVAETQNVSLLLADTPASNIPAIRMFEKVGLVDKTEHVYLTRQVGPTRGERRNLVSDEGTVDFTYSAKKKNISIRNMEIEDLYSVYILGEQIFTAKSINLFNFWDEDVVLQSYQSDSDLCLVATVSEGGDERVVGFSFGTTIEKPRSSWKYGYLVWTGCSPDYQGLGLASQLYKVMQELFLLKKVRMLMIDTQENNEAALKFFRKLGFGHDEKHLYLSGKVNAESL